MKQFYIASNINLHAIFILFPFFSLFLFGVNGGNYLPVGFAHCIIVKRREVYVCHLLELCPSPSLIMAMATPSSLAVVAQLWRAT